MKTQNDATFDKFEVFLSKIKTGHFKENVGVLYFNNDSLLIHHNLDIHIQSTLFILVYSGHIKLLINHKEHIAVAGQMILLSFGHFINIQEVSKDFECVSLYIGITYVDEMYSTDMLYKRVKYGVKMFNYPILDLNSNEFILLKKRIEAIEEVIQIQQHRYLKELTLNTLRIYFLELSNLLEDQYENGKDIRPSREELYFQQFLSLAVKHYKVHHKVDFYASQIHITPHYLTLIVKKLGGQTVSDFIYQLVYSEAKLLLKQPEYTIQQISDMLHFSDQSAFGKFFKRKNNKSPLQFRNNYF